MKDYININLGMIASSPDDDAKTAYAENAVKKIAAAVGWSANGTYLMSPDMCYALRFYVYNRSISPYDPCFGAALCTRSESTASWSEINNSNRMGSTWCADGITYKNAIVTIVKSVSEASWCMALGNGADNPSMAYGIFSNADKKLAIHTLVNYNPNSNSYRATLCDGNIFNSTDDCGILSGNGWIVKTSAKRTAMIPMPDPVRGSYFVDVFRAVSVAGASCNAGDIYFADGAYYRYVGAGFLIRVS